jgi:F0F1-type ATP synthase assembly protein I
MSQDLLMENQHQTPVQPATSTKSAGDAAAPVAAVTKKAFGMVSMSSVGLEFGISVVIGALFGRWLDSEFHTGPWLMLLFICLGFAAGVRALVRATRAIDKEAQARHG